VEVEAVIEGLQRLAIHGSPYWRVFYSLDGDRETIYQAQLSDEAIDPNLVVGESVWLTMILRTVMEIRRVDRQD
jgi:hypothetical protein